MGKYDPWDEFFANLSEDDIELGFDELQAILGRSLPASARKWGAWWSSAQHHAKWVRHGFVAKPDLQAQRVRFVRREPRRGSPPVEPMPAEENRRLILVGCVKRKRSTSAPAKDLYVSPLWQKRRAYAAQSGMPWAILSAEHGLVDPDEILEPYDRYLGDQSSGYKREWSQKTAAQVLAKLQLLGLDRVEIHAGASYVESGLRRRLEASGVRVDWPVEGLRFGEQLAWYDAGPNAIENQAVPMSTAREDFEPGPEPEIPTILEIARVGPFTYRWPDAVESFQHGWEGKCLFGGREVRFHHGVGRRKVYGAERVHTVTWIDGQPVVEGVAADDYHRSRSLLSLIKLSDGTMARTPDQVPVGYHCFEVVDHRSELDAPYSRRGMAVKIRVDDVHTWLHHASLRRHLRGTQALPRIGNSGPATVTPSAARSTVSVLQAEERLEHLSDERKREIAETLVAFGESEAALVDSSGPPEYTGDPDADRLLADDPFAFLVAVIADQGVRAERAWMVPAELLRRLGHLDPARMVADPEVVMRAFRDPAPLHRFVENVPRWIVAAAERVLRHYGGDAGRIWGDEPSAAELQERLRAFQGVGQKKAAMAVELLERDFGIPIRKMEGSDIAYDVHVRRVFLRTGLAERDDVEHMVEVARRVYPERPGALDGPAWAVGRNWCRPTSPLCGECPLDRVCAHRISAANGVAGV